MQVQTGKFRVSNFKPSNFQFIKSNYFRDTTTSIKIFLLSVWRNL